MKGKPEKVSSLKLANPIIHQAVEQIIDKDEWSRDIINFRFGGTKTTNFCKKAQLYSDISNLVENSD
ncbi:hypothetical protein WA1_51435 [Scytonema hofmannii PCC 7110]|uniref:Uncharacterized protein n=1 Tax=Scytonema hofmannii PCC 7110 TaxID=128403 RepID=A0A139WQA5_9CYAN|nr:hypothetical protein [Scytonema hofmannii]KYC34612.1 hypothetical protein WA1_51435 [Scytonema hofmannii PCC 7110]